MVRLIRDRLPIGDGLAMDRGMGEGHPDWSRIGGLEMDWQIGSGLVMDQHMTGRWAEDWHRIDMDRRISNG